MTKESVDRLVKSYMTTNVLPKNRYVHESSRLILRQLLLKGFSIAEVKRMSRADIEAMELEWPEKQDITKPGADFYEWWEQKDVTRTDIIEFLIHALGYKPLAEEEADRLVSSYIPKVLDKLTGGEYIREFARYILRQLLLKGFSIADLKIMEHADIEAVELEWLGQESVAKTPVIASLKDALLYKLK